MSAATMPSSSDAPYMVGLDHVLAKCDHLVATRLWPFEQELPYRQWLSNFPNDEQVAAAQLLSQLIYVSKDMAQAAFVAAYRRLIGAVAADTLQATALSRDAIAARQESIVIAPIRGERPSASDSGYSYVRMARDHLGFPEDQIADNLAAAIQLPARQEHERIIVLVDDVIGTGQQAAATIRDGLQATQTCIADLKCQVTLLVTVITTYAYNAITSDFPHIRIFAGHVIDTERYSVCSTLPPSRYPDTHKLLKKIAHRLSVPCHVDPAYGFGKFGLILVFHDCAPDFSLPIIWADGGSDWTPLKRRTNV